MAKAEHHPISRRTLISGAAVASTLAMPAAAGTIGNDPIFAALPGNDPIFAAIQRHRDAWAAMLVTVHAQGELEGLIPRELRQSHVSVTDETIVETDDPRWIASERASLASWKAIDDAADALLDCATTIAGVAALLAYVYEAEKKEGAASAWPENYVDEDSEFDWDRQNGVSWTAMLHKSLAEALPRMITELGLAQT
jgi:hypothetical protein